MEGFEDIPRLAALHKGAVLAEHSAQEHSQVLDEVLFGVVALGVGFADVYVQW